jgi:hypothetical protein
MMGEALSKHFRMAGTGVVAAVASTVLWAGSAAADPIYMPTVTKEIQQQRAAPALNPPPPPCPQYPVVSCTPVPEAFATTSPGRATWPTTGATSR